MAAESGRKYKHDILMQKVCERGWIHKYMYQYICNMKYLVSYSCSPKEAVGKVLLDVRNNVTAVEILSSDLFIHL